MRIAQTGYSKRIISYQWSGTLGRLVAWFLGPVVSGSPWSLRIGAEAAGTPVAAGAQGRTAIQESAAPGTGGAGNTPADCLASPADCPGPASTDRASPGSRRE